MSTSNIVTDLSSLSDSEHPIILVADVPECEALIWVLRENGIEVTAICDNIKDKSLRKSFGKEVIHTPTLPERFSNANFIIVSQQIQDCLEQLSGFGFSNFFSPIEAFKEFQNRSGQDTPAFDAYTFARMGVCIKSHQAYLEGANKLYMRSLDVMVTTRCSLKCESCSNLMQYYKNPQNSSTEGILSSIQQISSHVDEIAEFRLIGGEPLMNRDWHTIAKKIAMNFPNQQIFVYTNGTIAPKDHKLEPLEGLNINFVITKYGYLSRNIDKLEDQLQKFGFSFQTSDADFWVDCSSLHKHHRKPSQLREVFKQCCVKYLYTLLDGKLFRCPFIANAHKLNAITDNKADYVDLLDSSVDQGKQIRRLIQVSSFFPGCDFCVGRPYDATATVTIISA